MNRDIAQISKDIEPIIKEAGEILLSHFNTVLEIHKKSDGSFATNADLAAEQYLKKQLADLVPGVAFNAEESGKNGDNCYCFVVDPLDGTTNFSRGIGYFCVSVCLTYNDEPQLAVIYQPLTKEYFQAIKGQQTVLNGRTMDISAPIMLDDSMTVVGLPYAKNNYYQELLDCVHRIATESLVSRHLGACALDLAYVAAGRINGTYMADLAWWDVAAGILLVEQAGGSVTDFDGNPVRPGFKTCLAGSPQVYKQLKKIIDQVRNK